MTDVDTTTPAKVSGTYTLLKDIYEKVQVAGSGSISVKAGGTSWYDFKAGEITQGNALQVSMNDPTGALTAQGFDFLPTIMNMSPPLSKYTSFTVNKDQFVV